jgi:nucleoside phosphorylase
MIKTKNINLFLFDTEENYQKSKDFLGSSFKSIIQIESLEEFNQELTNLDPNELVSLAVHVFYTDKISGIRRFKASTIIEEFPNLEIMYISDGDEKEIKHQMIEEKIPHEEVYKYHQVNSNLREGVIKPISKNELFGIKKQIKEREKFEFGIITALYNDEFEEVKKHFTWLEEETVIIGTKRYNVGHLKNNSKRKVVAAIPSATGMVDSAIIATQMLELFRPKYLLMSGVCGGIEKTNFGDIVLAQSVFTFQKGKVSDLKSKDGKILQIYDHNKNIVDYENLYDEEGNQIKISIEKFEIEHDSILEFKLKDYTDPELKRIEKEINNSDGVRFKTPVAIHFEPMACSSMVINKQGFFEDHIKSVNRKTTAVEMESYAVARACQFGNEGKTHWVIFKSVMDNTKDKDDSAKSYAAHTSALFLKHLIYDGILN